MSSERAVAALEASGIDFTLTRHGRVGSLEEAAAARGVHPARVLKTIVVRRAEDDYLFVLVPGDRQISWPKLRALLGVSRLSMPDKEVARDGHLGSSGAGEPGVAATVDGQALVAALGAQVADVTEPL